MPRSSQRPIKHTLVVPRGWENHADVQRAYGALQARFGREHVELVIEEPPPDADRPADEPPDLSPRRVVRVRADEDE